MTHIPLRTGRHREEGAVVLQVQGCPVARTHDSQTGNNRQQQGSGRCTTHHNYSVPESRTHNQHHRSHFAVVMPFAAGSRFNTSCQTSKVQLARTTRLLFSTPYHKRAKLTGWIDSLAARHLCLSNACAGLRTPCKHSTHMFACLARAYAPSTATRSIGRPCHFS